METKTENTYVPKIGYKGFDSNLKCGGLGGAEPTQYEIGKIYYKDNKENPKLCSTDGFHYCNTLDKVFHHYPNNKTNRFCEIEILGNFTDTPEKSITTAFRIKREITKEDLEVIKNKELAEEMESNFNLEEVRFLQKQNPYCHVGGSVALFLKGLKLKRWEKSIVGDIDLVCPFFFQWTKTDEFDIEYKDAKASGNDFDETFILNSIKVDVKIDNTQRYEVVKYNGHDYKISLVETILEAKLRYALNGQKKHKSDIYELIGLIK